MLILGLDRNPALLSEPGTRRLRWVTFAVQDFLGLGSAREAAEKITRGHDLEGQIGLKYR